MIFVRGGRPGGIFEKSEEGTKERNFFLFFVFFEFFSLLDSFCSLIKSSRLRNNRLGSNLQKYALKLSFFGF